MVRLLILLLATHGSICWASIDPTAPINWQTPKLNEAQPIEKSIGPLPILQSIVCKTSVSCQAILDGEVVLVGEYVSGYRIKSIEAETVTLSNENGLLKLELFPLEIKQ